MSNIGNWLLVIGHSCRRQAGYSMVELLVVIAAMVILGTVAIANFGGLQKAQALQKEVSNVQSFLKAAQANATTRVPCPPTGTDSGASWIVTFTATTLSLTCQLGSATPYATPIRVHTLKESIVIQKISDPTNTANYTISTLGVKFAPLYGTTTFYSDCLTPCSTLMSDSRLLFTLRNPTVSPAADKVLVLDKGGSVYEQ